MGFPVELVGKVEASGIVLEDPSSEFSFPLSELGSILALSFQIDS